MIDLEVYKLLAEKANEVIKLHDEYLNLVFTKLKFTEKTRYNDTIECFKAASYVAANAMINFKNYRKQVDNYEIDEERFWLLIKSIAEIGPHLSKISITEINLPIFNKD